MLGLLGPGAVGVPKKTRVSMQYSGLRRRFSPALHSKAVICAYLSHFLRENRVRFDSSASNVSTGWQTRLRALARI